MKAMSWFVAAAVLVAANLVGCESNNNNQTPSGGQTTDAGIVDAGVPPTGNPDAGGADAGVDAGIVLVYSANGVAPRSISVGMGQVVTFVNSDSVAHEPASNPHPIHTDCPEFNVGTISPGTSATATAPGTSKTCGLHDHLNPFNTNFQVSVTVTSQ